MKRHIHLGQLLHAVMLVDPSGHLERRRRGLDDALLVEYLDRGVVDRRRRKLERHGKRASGDIRRNLGKALDVLALLLARRVAQVVERCPVLAAEDVVQRRAQPARPLLDEGILRADRLGHLGLEHDAQFVGIDDHPRELRQRCLCGCTRALPEQVVGQEDRQRVVRLMPNEHRRGRNNRPAMLADDSCELRGSHGLNLHRVGSPNSLAPTSPRDPSAPLEAPHRAAPVASAARRVRTQAAEPSGSASHP